MQVCASLCKLMRRNGSMRLCIAIGIHSVHSDGPVRWGIINTAAGYYSERKREYVAQLWVPLRVTRAQEGGFRLLCSAHRYFSHANSYSSRPAGARTIDGRPWRREPEVGVIRVLWVFEMNRRLLMRRLRSLNEIPVPLCTVVPSTSILRQPWY
jgi:hypothetical protein